jgi:hypothetical protein
MSYFEQHLDFIEHLDAKMQEIVKDGKLLISDIPHIVALFTELLLIKPSLQDTQETLQQFYNYILAHYKLFPTDATEQAAFNKMFELCVKLILFPASKKKVLKHGNNNYFKKLFSCFKKAKHEIVQDMKYVTNVVEDEIQILKEQVIEVVQEQVIETEKICDSLA